VQGYLPWGQETIPEDERIPCPYLRIQKTDTKEEQINHVEKLKTDILRGRQPTKKETEVYRNCLSVMDDVSEDNMDMLERVGEFLGRLFTGQQEGWGKGNLLKAYVKEYVLKKKAT
jgi:hypothetical protein